MANRNIYSVAQVNSYIKNMYAQDFMLRQVSIKGEVSNCKYHTSGHIYFTIKDAGAAMNAIMFAGILMLGGVPENKFSEYLKVANVKEVSDISCGSEAVDHLLETYGYLIGEERKVIELANEAGDDVTADLMTRYLKEQEKMVWMLVAFSTKSCTK